MYLWVCSCVCVCLVESFLYWLLKPSVSLSRQNLLLSIMNHSLVFQLVPSLSRNQLLTDYTPSEWAKKFACAVWKFCHLQWLKKIIKWKDSLWWVARVDMWIWRKVNGWMKGWMDPVSVRSPVWQCCLCLRSVFIAIIYFLGILHRVTVGLSSLGPHLVYFPCQCALF